MSESIIIPLSAGTLISGITLVITWHLLFMNYKDNAAPHFSIFSDKPRQLVLTALMLIGSLNGIFAYSLNAQYSIETLIATPTSSATTILINTTTVISFIILQFGLVIINHNSCTRFNTFSLILPQKTLDYLCILFYLVPGMVLVACVYYHGKWHDFHWTTAPPLNRSSWNTEIYKPISLLFVLATELFATLTDFVLIVSVLRIKRRVVGSGGSVGGMMMGLQAGTSSPRIGLNWYKHKQKLRNVIGGDEAGTNETEDFEEELELGKHEEYIEEQAFINPSTPLNDQRNSPTRGIAQVYYRNIWLSGENGDAYGAPFGPAHVISKTRAGSSYNSRKGLPFNSNAHTSHRTHYPSHHSKTFVPPFNLNSHHHQSNSAQSQGNTHEVQNSSHAQNQSHKSTSSNTSFGTSFDDFSAVSYPLMLMYLTTWSVFILDIAVKTQIVAGKPGWLFDSSLTMLEMALRAQSNILFGLDIKRALNC